MAQEDQHLRDFIQQVNELYEIKTPGHLTGFDEDFQNLKRVSTGLKQSKDHESLAGQKPENKKKNRYKDIFPFDSTRVRLNTVDGDPCSDYINASFIKGPEGHTNYIASQGPLPNTVAHFWQMLWQYNVRVIIMVCREIELGKRKCERYWSDVDGVKVFNDITVSLAERETFNNGYCLRTIKAEKGTETRYIQQFHYTSWPDHGVPKTCYEIITLINHARDIQSYRIDETNPLCVHCSAGCGRTGAVLAVDYVRNLLEKKRVPAGLRTFDIIAEMRKQRQAIVQTKDQYEFVNMAISEMFRTYLKTRSVSYKDFNEGLKQEDYVNISIKPTPSTSHNGMAEKRPSVLNYENIDIIRKQQNSLGVVQKLNSFEDYPEGSPPPKPSREISFKPPNPRTATPSDGGSQMTPGINIRKASAPVVHTNFNVGDKKYSLGVAQNLKPRSPNFPKINGRNPATQPKPTTPTKPGIPSTKPKPLAKPEPAPKSFSSVGQPKPQVGAKPSPSSKPDDFKKRAPAKPQRSFRRESPMQRQKDASDPHAANNKNVGNFQKYDKKNVYNDVKFSEEGDGDYAELDGVPRSNSIASISSLPGKGSSTPPKLPARTVESQMFVDESPPELPARTPDSYIAFQGGDKQTYEAIDQTSRPRSPHPEPTRRSSGNVAPPSSSGTSVLAAKAKGMLEKTSMAFSKVGASIAKSMDDDTSTPPPSTIQGRTPTYTPGPVMYGGQDLSFGKRFHKKVRGPRK